MARRRRIAEAHITFEPKTAYRCVGGIIYELQRANIPRIGFISEPATDRD